MHTSSAIKTRKLQIFTTSMLASLANDRDLKWFYSAGFVHFKSPLEALLGIPEQATLLGEWLNRLRGDALRNELEIRMGL